MHILQVSTVLYPFHKAAPTWNLNNCMFFTENAGHFEQMIRASKLELADYTTKTFGGLKQLHNITELKSLLSLCTVYRRIVPNFTCISAPHNLDLEKKGPKNVDTIFHEGHDSMGTNT